MPPKAKNTGAAKKTKDASKKKKVEKEKQAKATAPQASTKTCPGRVMGSNGWFRKCRMKIQQGAETCWKHVGYEPAQIEKEKEPEKQARDQIDTDFDKHITTPHLRAVGAFHCQGRHYWRIGPHFYRNWYKNKPEDQKYRYQHVNWETKDETDKVCILQSFVEAHHPEVCGAMRQKDEKSALLGFEVCMNAHGTCKGKATAKGKGTKHHWVDLS
jgi:hypothetical protein